MGMKVIIAGSRTIEDDGIVFQAIEESPFEVTEIVSGTAKGPDSAGALYGSLTRTKVTKFPANWNKYGKSAGYRRNEEG